MRRHDYVQKKVVGFIQDFYFDYIRDNIDNEEKEKWDNFLDEISIFDNYDNYIDNMILDNDKTVLVQYYYSHVDNDGKLSNLDTMSDTNIWIKDNINYYREVEKLMHEIKLKNMK